MLRWSSNVSELVEGRVSDGWRSSSSVLVLIKCMISDGCRWSPSVLEWIEYCIMNNGRGPDWSCLMITSYQKAFFAWFRWSSSVFELIECITTIKNQGWPQLAFGAFFQSIILCRVTPGGVPPFFSGSFLAVLCC